MDITTQPQEEKDAVVRTNIRNTIKRIQALDKERGNLVDQLKQGLDNADNQRSCSEYLKPFQEAISQL